jgi:peptidoglycan/xylan/chitin deacetylase (PgdA/CDA1 family)
MAKWLGCRRFSIPSTQPIISFTFDDFPRSALFNGGAILEEHGVAGTYYVALGLMSRMSPTGEIFHPDDLGRLFRGDHELGCHTFDHFPAWETNPEDYEESVSRNSKLLVELAPRARLETHSFPISYPRPATKRRLSHRFRGCRGGGQTINAAGVDLNYLSSFFLEQSRDNFQPIHQLISRNAQERGWLIFSTHDVSADPTQFGCTPKFFEKVVQHAVASGSKILKMSAAMDDLGIRSSES